MFEKYVVKMTELNLVGIPPHHYIETEDSYIGLSLYNINKTKKKIEA